MKITAIIQARTGSTRLPGKVLMDLEGETVLCRVIRRLQRSTLIREVVIATTTSNRDDAIVDEGVRLGVPVFRGQETDVLDRYWQASVAYGGEVLVRVTSDCPLIDPDLTDQTIRAFLERRVDYASNCLERSYPRGLDTEVFTCEALSKCWKKAVLPYERSHVTPYIYQHPDSFKLYSVRGKEDHSEHRWTVDTVEDLDMVRAVYKRFGGRDDFRWEEVLALVKCHFELAEINRLVRQKSLHEG